MSDILVVGAGPTGLTMAAVLARHGLRPRIIDKAIEPPADRSRAIVIQARTLELFEDLGIVQEVLEAGLIVDAINIVAPNGKRGSLRIKPEWLDSTYGRVLSLPQEETERILGALVDRSGLSVERGLELTALRDGPDGVEVRLRRADGSMEDTSVQWVIGCDGAHSTVRHLAGLPFAGGTYPDEGLLGDVELDWPLPEGQVSVCPSADGVLLAFPLSGPKHFRVIMILPATQQDESRTLTQDEFLEKLRLMAPRAADGSATTSLIASRWLTRYRLHRRGVPSYRAGRCFVAGDAAHIHSPVGAQGMNTGIQDAYNLAWKLALVARHEAPASLLDSYDEERRPVGEHLLRTTDRMFSMLLGGGDIGRRIRQAAPLAAVRMFGAPFIGRRIARFVSQTGIRYRNSDLSVEAHGAARLDGKAPRAGDRAPDAALGADRRLHALMHGPRHTLLLFAGDSTALIEHFTGVGAEVIARYRRMVKPVVLRLTPSHPAIGEVDVHRAAHERYGAAHGGIYLIRPDGYVAFRGSGTDTEALRANLRTRFITPELTRH